MCGSATQFWVCNTQIALASAVILNSAPFNGLLDAPLGSQANSGPTDAERLELVTGKHDAIGIEANDTKFHGG